MMSGPLPELGQTPAQEAPEVSVAEQLGERLSPAVRGLRFTDSEGESVRLGDYLGRGRPVLLTFTYHSCPMLCSLVLDGAAQALAETTLQPGEDFEAVNVSFDPRDTPDMAARVKASYVGQVAPQHPDIARHWHFLTGREEAARALADAVGFGYAWDPQTAQYAHNAVLIFLAPDGTITRYLYGLGYPARDVRLALVESGLGEVGSTLDRLLLTCFQFDAEARSYTPAILTIMKLGGVLLLAALAVFFVPLWLRERRRPAPDALGPLAGLRDDAA